MESVITESIVEQVVEKKLKVTRPKRVRTEEQIALDKERMALVRNAKESKRKLLKQE